MMFPEHTVESYKAAAMQGAGIVECDVTFTKDLELVCRHSQCDLHTTTDVVTRPELNAKCTTPWSTGVSPNCCTSDFTLEEIKSMCGKMDSAGDVNGATAEEYAYGGTADWRTELYSSPASCPEIPTHMESIELLKSYDAKFTPELKSPSVEMPFLGGDFTQEAYAQKMIDEYIAAGIPPSDVWPQSFNDEDVIYWVKNTDFGDQAVALDGVYSLVPEVFMAWHQRLQDNGVKIVAPPMWMLVNTTEFAAAEISPLSQGLGMGPSEYTQSAKAHGLDIITWTLERSDPGLLGWYWQSLATNELVDGDKFALLQVLAEDVGVLGVFSDWPATVTFFANCMNYGMRNAGDDAVDDEEDASECVSVDDLCEDAEFSIFCGLVDEFGIKDVVSSGTWTVFVPTNEAIERVMGVLSTLDEDSVKEILEFHLFQGDASAMMECKETIEMFSGKDSRTICTNDAVYQVGGTNRVSGTEPKFLSEAEDFCGGKYYVMSEVMLPTNILP
jgi:glycerophosphoryl diester phosphodiesterase